MENRFKDHTRPYYALDDYLKGIYGEKVYKVALDGGFTCPSRDGRLDTRGCIFCSASGSGDFSISCHEYPDIRLQLEKGISLFSAKRAPERFIAYFQAFTGTYAAPEYCRKLYLEALSHPKVCGISIATRPDCLSKPIFEVLDECRRLYPDKTVWIELGLQTVHASTASYIRRHYPLETATDAILCLHEHSIPTILHIILGLPRETPEMVLQTIDYVNHMHVFGIKLQLLHVLKGTDLARDYAGRHFKVLTKDEYLRLLICCLEHLDPDIVIHRVTGDGPRELTIAPLWSLNKRDVLNSLHHEMRLQDSWQGKYFTG
ncbi:MAG: TIGR01212 family radical SAM protein [Lachnospiraceae bacterium]|jgi:hypothetical protein|nr:TIGR01212 family radical SAM protein [Lachnospiraceae bacterium]